MIRPEAENELHWTAARYVMGELDAADFARFESLLADDQAAREAVADAVRLLQALTTASPIAATRRRSWGVIGSCLAMAACLIVGVAIYLTPNSTQTADAKGAQKKGLAETAGDDWILGLPELLESQVAADDSESSELLVPASFEEVEGEIPGWLILATSKVEMP